MKKLIERAHNLLHTNRQQVFALYSSVYEQTIKNVPIAKPLLVFVLNGEKEIGLAPKQLCTRGQFVFLSDSYTVDIRNIPTDKKYLALLVEFERQDFEDLPLNHGSLVEYFIGDTTPSIEQCIAQFIDSTEWAPSHVIALRRKEILMMLVHCGYHAVSMMAGKHIVSHRVHSTLIKNNFQDISTKNLAQELGMSQSTLQRKLKAENTSLQEIKDKARLGRALHLLQTTEKSISDIADQCGFQSQSRFAHSFKHCFGLTPTDLRKTRAAVYKE